MRRSAGVRIAGLTAIVTVALTACTGSVAGPTQPPIPTGITAPPPTPIAQPSASPTLPTISPKLPAEIAGVDTTGWQQIAGPENAVTFRIPPGWTTEEADGTVVVKHAEGQQQLVLARDAPVGDGSCRNAAGESAPWRSVLLGGGMPAAGVEGASFSATALQLDGQWIIGVGLVPNEAAVRPRCPIVHAVETSNGTWSFGSEPVVTGVGGGELWAVPSLEAAKQYAASESFLTIRAVLASLEVAG